MIQKAQFEPNNRSFEARLEMSNQAEQLSDVGTALSRPKASNSNSFIYQGGAQSDANVASREAEESMGAGINQSKPEVQNQSTDLENKFNE